MGLEFKEYIIGKSPSSDFQVKGDKTVSRTHAKIFVNEENQVFVTDLNSTNGTFINGKKLKKGSGQMLKDYEILAVGNSTVNWRAIVKNDNNQAEKIVDSNSFKETKISQGSGKGVKIFFIVIIAIMLIAGIATLLLTTTDKQKVIGKWSSFDGNVSYEFSSDGTFSYDSLGNYKTGDWIIYKNDDGIKKMELKYDENDMPIYIKDITLGPRGSERSWEGGFSNSYSGNLLNIKNKYEYPIKILGFSPNNYKKPSRNSRTRIWMTPANYRLLVSVENINGQTREYSDHEMGWRPVGSQSVKNLEEVVLSKDVLIPPGELYGFLIESETKTYYIYDRGKKRAVDPFKKDSYVDIIAGQATLFDNEILFGKIQVGVRTRSSANWRGTIRYGLMQHIFDWNFYFLGNDQIVLNRHNKYYKNIE